MNTTQKDQLTQAERDAIRKWLAGEAPKPPAYLHKGAVVRSKR